MHIYTHKCMKLYTYHRYQLHFLIENMLIPLVLLIQGYLIHKYNYICIHNPYMLIYIYIYTWIYKTVHIIIPSLSAALFNDKYAYSLRATHIGDSHICIYIYMYVYKSTYIFIYLYIHTIVISGTFKQEICTFFKCYRYGSISRRVWRS
jgi:hypothetical protein